MTVAQLIEALSELDPTTLVVIPYSSSEYSVPVEDVRKTFVNEEWQRADEGGEGTQAAYLLVSYA